MGESGRMMPDSVASAACNVSGGTCGAVRICTADEDEPPSVSVEPVVPEQLPNGRSASAKGRSNGESSTGVFTGGRPGFAGEVAPIPDGDFA